MRKTFEFQDSDLNYDGCSVEFCWLKQESLNWGHVTITFSSKTASIHTEELNVEKI